jgi:uncharacterized repeat protein (TIGR01451 family)
MFQEDFVKVSASKRRMISHVLLIAIMALGALVLPAQSVQAAVSLTTLGAPYTQSFDTLPTSGSATWTNDSTIPGWFHARTGTGTTIVANNGSSNAGNLYSYGTGTTTDRALGSVGSGNAAVGNLFWGVGLTNNTGATITSLDISYTGEQWRNSAAAAQTVAFSYLVGSPTVTGSLAEFQSAGVAVPALDFVSPITGGAAGALDGNLAANRVTLSFSITGLSIPNGTEVMLRWSDPDHTGADHGLSIDDFSITPQGAVATPTLNISDVTLGEGDPPGTTTFTFAVSLTAPAGAGGVTFDIATADGTAEDDNPATEDNDYVAQSLTGQTISSTSTGPYDFSVTVNRDTAAESNETFFVNVTNITGANAGDTQGLGTINNDDISLSLIHDVQGNGAATPIPGATAAVEGVVIGDYQTSTQLQGFFLQEEDADVDADPNTSEGIFVFCSSCPTAVAEGQRVRVTGTVSEFFDMTQITASTAGSVVVTEAGNHLAEVTPASIDLPVVGDINTFYEAREGMRVAFVDTLTVSEYFELFRFGQIELFEGGRPHQFTEQSTPSVAGYTVHLDNLDRRRVILDDDNNTPNAPLNLSDGSQLVYHPRANGGFSVGTQGTDFFRGGDLVNGLTGVLHWSFAGSGSDDAWRIRPTNATPAAFTVANPRPATPPAVGGAIKAVSMNLLNYFTTIDTTSSSSSGPCGPSMTLDCRGADSVAELNRQRERASIAICSLNADVYAFMELENTTASGTINDLLGAVNARCGGANPYAFVNTGGTLGTDAIRVALIHRSATLSPIGAPLADLDPIHNRPPTAQTFDIVDTANPAFGQRFTVIANHFKSKGCPGTGADADAGDGQGCFNSTRTSQAARLLTWISGTVLPAAGDPDVLLLGDFNSYAKEDPITTLTGGGYTDLALALLGPSAYSYLFDGQLGHLDYAFASASLASQITGIGNWHINADEVPLFDYSDEGLDSPGEASFEEKPDGSALVPPRVVFQPASPYRASDHDPVIVGLFRIADLSVSKVDTPDPVSAGTNLTYTITLTNAGPNVADTVSLSDTLPAGTTFKSLTSPGGWSCTTPAVGSGGTVSCGIANMPVGSAIFTLTVQVDANVAHGTVLSNTAAVSSTTSDPTPGNQSATATTTVIDGIAPTVTINQAAGQADPALSSPVNFTVVFNEPVSGFDSTDVNLSGTASATTAVVTEIGPMNGTTYNVAVSGMTASGTVIAAIPAGAAIDAAANTNTASTSTDDTVTFAPVFPVATGIVRAGASPTNATSVQFTVTFSEDVTSVDSGDFSLASSGVTGASIASVSGSGTTRIVSVNTGGGSGTLGLNLVDNDSILDTTSTPLGGSGAGNGNFTGQVYTLDKTAPQAGSLVATNITVGGGATHSFTVVFSDNLAIDSASLDGNDIRVSGPSGFDQLATFVSVTPAGNGTPRTTTYRINAPGGAWDNADTGSYTLALQANQVRDGVGNPVAARVLGAFSVAISAPIHKVFLPAVQTAGTPDLVVTSISLVPSKSAFAAGEPVEVRVTVTNQGSAAAGSFWVDLYINPSSSPTAADQLWNTRCGLTPCFGMAWQVVGGLAPGQSITLSSLSLPAGYSIWPGYFAAGTSDLYAYADSYNPGVAAGAAAESNEANNRGELHGLSVTGPNPALRGMGDRGWEMEVRPRR